MDRSDGGRRWLQGLLCLTLVCSLTATAAPREKALMAAGPDSLAYLLSFWLVDMKAQQDAAVRIQSADNDAVPELMLAGAASIGAMTRPMTLTEMGALRARHGTAPVEVRVALDALAVYVHKDNPLPGISLAQLDGVFSTTRRCGHPENIIWWDQLGLSDDWQLRQIELYGPNGASGARAVFGRDALCGGDHKATLEMSPTRTDLLRAVARNGAAIAYAGWQERVAGVRAIPLSRKTGDAFIAPSKDSVRDGRYPLTRFVYLYAANSQEALAFLRLTLSPRGQERVTHNNFVPLPAAIIEEELRKLR
jgi:phosphate transport system substrate-binding protein